MTANNIALRIGIEGNAQVEAAIRKIGETTRQQFDAASKSVGLARYEIVNLSRQAQDIGVSLASGQSPFTVLIQQGTQVFDILGSREGGLGGGIKALGASLAGVLTPATAAGAAIAAAAAVAVVSLNRWQAAQDALTVSLNGLGRASGLTLSQVNAIAGNAGARGGLSVNAAQGLAAQYLSAGVSGNALPGAIGLTRDFGRKLGLKDDEAASTIARALADPAKGAKDLADAYGLLTRAQRLQIEQTAGMGDKAGAAAKLVDVLSSRLKELEDPTWRLSRVLENMGNRISDFVTKTGEGFTSPPSAETVFNRMRRASGGQQQALLDNATERLSGLLNISQDAELAAKAITATTYAEREAVLMEKARVDALRDSANALKINTQAEAERTRMLAEATAKVEDYARSTSRSIEGLGKTAFERARLQARQERDDVLRQVPADEATPRGAAPARRETLAQDETRRVARPRSATARSTDALVAEAERRGLDPTEENFARLKAEGVGAEKPEPRIIPTEPATNAVAAPRPSGLARRVRRSAEEVDAAIVREAQQAPLRQVSDDLAAYNRLLDAQASAFGKSAGEAAKLQKEQELLNQYTREHIPVTAEMRAQIAQTAEEWGRYVERLQKVQEKNQDLIQSLDQIRGTASGALSSFVGDLVRGESAGAALNRVLDQILQTAINIAAQKLAEGLFGKSGTNGADSAGGGFLGSLFSSAGSAISNAFPFADGGIMTSAGALPVHRYDTGGVASRPQLAIFGEGRKPEAYIPLDDGKTVPLDVTGGAPRVMLPGGRSIPASIKAGGDVREWFLKEFDARLLAAAETRARATEAVETAARGSAVAAQTLPSGSALAARAAETLAKGAGVAAFATGGIMTSAGALPVHRYDTGGVASRPQLAIFGEGRKPEAYIPLDDGKTVPLDVTGGAPRVLLPGGRSIPASIKAGGDVREWFLKEFDARLLAAAETRARATEAVETAARGSAVAAQTLPSGSALAARAAETLAKGAGVAAFATGGIMTSAGALPVHRYDTGGVASRPQLAIFGEGRKPEAYIPLDDGKTVPLDVTGGAPRVMLPGGRSIPASIKAGGDVREWFLKEFDARLLAAAETRARATEAVETAARGSAVAAQTLPSGSALAARAAETLAKGAGVAAFATGGIMTSAGPLTLAGPSPTPSVALPSLPIGPALPAAFGTGFGASEAAPPKISIHNYAGVDVEPRVTRGEIRLMIRQEQARNNAQLPGMMAAYERARP